jgi:hypothetical protein
LSVREAGSCAVVDAGLEPGQAGIDVELGKGIDVLLSCLICCLEIVSDVLKGLAKLGVVHVGRLKGAAFGVFALYKGLDRGAESMRSGMAIAMLVDRSIVGNTCDLGCSKEDREEQKTRCGMRLSGVRRAGRDTPAAALE